MIPSEESSPKFLCSEKGLADCNKIIVGCETEQVGLKAGDGLTRLCMVGDILWFVIKKGKEKLSISHPVHGQGFLLIHYAMEIFITGIDMEYITPIMAARKYFVTFIIFS